MNIRLLVKFIKGLAGNERRRLIHFSISTTIFFVAYAMLYWIEQHMPPSIEQEWAALSCVSVAALAFSWAIALQIIYIASKMINK